MACSVDEAPKKSSRLPRVLFVKPAKTAALILRTTPLRPAIAIVLGSGFGAVQDAICPALAIPYRALPGFPGCQVAGHAGKLVIGNLAGVPLLALCGRGHYYEGHAMEHVTFPIRVLAACGVKVVLLTNAAGSINAKIQPGDFMCLTDHINFMGVNPLRGKASRGVAGFVDLSNVYDAYLGKILGKAARHARVRLQYGVYMAVSGPSYETPAEIRAFGRLGADAVGMSTVPEAIVSRQCGMRVAGVSCITNLSAGLNQEAISHAEVLAMGRRVKGQATALVTAFVRLLAGDLGDASAGW